MLVRFTIVKEKAKKPWSVGIRIKILRHMYCSTISTAWSTVELLLCLKHSNWCPRAIPLTFACPFEHLLWAGCNKHIYIVIVTLLFWLETLLFSCDWEIYKNTWFRNLYSYSYLMVEESSESMCSGACEIYSQNPLYLKAGDTRCWRDPTITDSPCLCQSLV